MVGNKFSSSTSCSKWPHETEPGRLDQEFSGRFLKVATHPSRPPDDTPRRDGVDRSGAWPAGREPDTRIATARRAAMDRATGRADRRSRLLSTPRSPPDPHRGPSSRPVSGSVSAGDRTDAAVQLHCLDPHGAEALTPPLGLCPCQHVTVV